MEIYITFYVLGLLCCYSDLAGRSSIYSDLLLKKSLNFMFFMLFFLIAGFRYRIGQPDWNNYHELFLTVNNGEGIPGGFEFGYIFLNKVISIFTDDSQLVFLITSLFSTIVYFYFVSKVLSGRYVFVALLVYIVSLYFILNMYVIRQQLALSFILLSIINFSNDRKLLALLLILIASTFHQTAFIFILLYPFVIRNYSVNLLLFIYGVFFTLMLLGVSFTDPILNALKIIPQLKSMIDLLMSIQGLNEERIGFIGVLERLIAFVFIVLNRDKLLRICGNRYLIIVFNLFVLYSLISIVFYQYAFIITRLNLYFSFSFPIMYAMSLHLFKSNQKVLLFSAILFYTFIKGALVLSSQPEHEENFVPYRSYIEVIV